MALTATLHQFAVQLADVDRGVYADFELRIARQPSETLPFLLTRVLAYCLEYGEGVVLSEGIAAVDEPAVAIRDLTGRINAWIEVGAPDADRLHRGAKAATRAAVYTHRDPANLLAQYAGARIHRAQEIPIHSFERGFLETASAAIERRNTLSVSVTERQLYLTLNEQAFSSALTENRIAEA